ncbi:flavin monoamine oxidase family protein [Conexibacter stalactiti]|uniref:Flavin monoamine oxidase family protein n=1 Tax=Conexibacter stalactiti TaxID=1940611 RepID=A0ABU4HPZ1_9ACTN|nr:flavin monoamine oxidase family protein [Conexibacter stalactiti]MDW5594794.1 flavin monoamine oxidase family protein [Conexibacter stalactiti]MEC5035436.1 flavin monoamine oxidase family protein [Conexibacter stalactiti]
MRRRDFLTKVGLAGGAGALYTTMDALGLVASPTNAPAAWAAETRAWQPPSASDFGLRGHGGRRRVLVLGAGIAGLVTAYELGKAGYRVTLVEARERPGGRNWTVRGGTVETELGGSPQRARFSDGQYLNAGPARLAQHMVTVDYCRELGVPIEVFTNANEDAYYYQEEVGGLSGQRIRHRTAKADVYGYVSELLAKSTDQGALDGRLTAEDRDRLIAFLRNFGAIGARRAGDPAGSYAYTGGSRRGYTLDPGAGTQEGDVLGPPFSLTDVLQSQVGNYFSFEFSYDQAMLMFQPVGGMDQIPYALARAVQRQGGQILYGTPVSEIVNTPDGVEVTVGEQRGWRPRVLRGDYAVCTVPPQVLKNVTSNFSAPVREALAYAVPNSVGKIALEYRRRFWEEDEKLIGGITNTNMDLSTIWYPSYGYLGERGTIVGYYNFGANAVAYGDLPPEGRLARAVAQGKKIHGDSYERELASSFSVAWQKIRYSEGGWVSWPSRTSGHYDRLLAPDGNVWFAGDHLSYYIAWQAGAIESARKVVRELHARAVNG